ncbi:MAG: ABC transporter substrate-binding protein [Candidatus Eremiobacteraeota bacterium]|nr:ABC transporter substrate-binding protein [Candidatus Eremiobacteraeota bacterium]
MITALRSKRFVSSLAALAIAAGCAGPSTSSGTNNSGGGSTLVVARVKDAVTLDPAQATDGLSLNLTQEILWGLVRFKPGTFDIEPALAQSWKSSPDGRHWTFVLRKGLKFSDGTPVDAAAVKWNFDRWRLTNNPNHGNDTYQYYAAMFGGFPGIITDVAAPNSSTVSFTLARPLAPFLHDLAMPSFAIGSPAAIRASHEAFARQPVGYGPYTLAEWVKDDHITLQANALFQSSAKPAYSTIIIRDIPDQATSVLSLQKGDVDVLTDPRPDDALQLAKQKGITIYQQPSNNNSYVALNMEKAPFQKLQVRQAIGYALNVPQIVRAFYSKGAEVADNWTPPKMLGENPAVKHYTYDPAKARSLLAQAGNANFSTQLYYPTAPRPYMPEPQRIAEALQANLKAVGINVTLVPFEWGVFLSKIRNGEHQMCLIGWSGDNGDPDNFFYPLLDQDSAHKPNAQNYSFWRDPNFHKLMLAGQATPDDAKRAAIYRQANAMVHDQAPAISIVHTTVPIAFKSSIGGYIPRPDTAINFELLKPKS